MAAGCSDRREAEGLARKLTLSQTSRGELTDYWLTSHICLSARRAPGKSAAVTMWSTFAFTIDPTSNMPYLMRPAISRGGA